MFENISAMIGSAPRVPAVVHSQNIMLIVTCVISGKNVALSVVDASKKMWTTNRYVSPWFGVGPLPKYLVS